MASFNEYPLFKRNFIKFNQNMDNCCENMYFYLNFFEALKMLDVNVSIKMKIGEKDFYIIYQISVSN